MTYEEIKFEEVKNKILNDFVPLLKAYGDFKKIEINDNDVDKKLQELESASKRFFISWDDKAEIEFAYASFQLEKEKGKP
ncbi:MAG: hypothetical protein AB7U43_09835 [Desulfobacter sp.]